MHTIFRRAAVLLLAAVVGVWFGVLRLPGANASRPAPMPVMTGIGGDFELSRAGGARVHLHDFRGRPVLLFFGYTHCPDVCPSTLYNLKLAMDLLGGAASRVQVIMVTIDPERDLPDELERYVQYFRPQFLGLSGSAQEIDTVARQYRVYRQKDETPSGERISHSAYVYLLDGRQQVRAVFSGSARPADFAEGVQQLLAETGSRG